MNFLNEPLFWALVFAIACGLVAAYFIIRQALIDSHFEIKRREEEERRGGKKP